MGHLFAKVTTVNDQLVVMNDQGRKLVPSPALSRSLDSGQRADNSGNLRGQQRISGQILLSVLAQLQGENSYVYFQTTADPDAGDPVEYEAADVPIVGHVQDLEHKAGRLDVRMSDVATMLTLSEKHPDFKKYADYLWLSMQGLLKDAAGKPGVVALMVESPTGSIRALEVKSELWNTAGSKDTATEVGRSDKTTFWRASPLMNRSLFAASLTESNRRSVDKQVRKWAEAGLTTRTGAGNDDIPHAYLWSYCWLRAELTTSALAAAPGGSCGKLWITPEDPADTIQLPTNLLPDRCTNWLYHVVTVFKAEDGSLRVVDPPFFSVSVDLDDYIASLGVRVNLYFGDASVYQITDIRHPVPLGASRAMITAHTKESWALLAFMEANLGVWPPW